MIERRLKRALAVVGVVASAMAGVQLPSSADGTPGWTKREQTSPASVIGYDTGGAVVIGSDQGHPSTVYAQQVAADGSLGARVEIATLQASCVPINVQSRGGTIAATATCEQRGEDAPSRVLEMVWTEATGWQTQVFKRSSPASVDLSPDGTQVVFMTVIQYFGDPEHITSWSASGGFVDMPRKINEQSYAGGAAAIDDAGRVVVVATFGFEDEPGYFFGGHVVVRRYAAADDAWVTVLNRRCHNCGYHNATVDRAGPGVLLATVIRSGDQPDGLKHGDTAWALFKQRGEGYRLTRITGRYKRIDSLSSGFVPRSTWETARGFVSFAGVGADKAVQIVAGPWEADSGFDGVVVDHSDPMGYLYTPGERLSMALSPVEDITLAWVTRDKATHRFVAHSTRFNEIGAATARRYNKNAASWSATSATSVTAANGTIVGNARAAITINRPSFVASHGSFAYWPRP